MLEPNPSPPKADLLELLLVLAREKRLLLRFTLAAAVVAAIIVLLVPKMYTARATILPPQQNQSVLSSLVGQSGAAAILDLRDLGVKDPSDVFIAMLRSRTAEDALVNRFDLRKLYHKNSYQDARKVLEKRSEIIPEKEGLISIKVEDHDPQRAADLANAWVEELHQLNQNLALTEAAQRRAFFEEKLEAERKALAATEVALKQFEQKTGLIQPDTQGKLLLQSVAELRAQITGKQVQLQSMRSYATGNNPDVKRVQSELAELRSQLAQISRTEAAGLSSEGSLQVPTGKVAEDTIAYMRAARDLKYHEALYDFLGKQLEAARIDEAKNAVVVQVVDKAVPPERKSGPPRLLIVAVTAVLAFVLAAFAVLLREALRRQTQDPGQRARFELLRNYLRIS